MTSNSSGSQILRSLSRDGRLLFTTRILRLFAYGFLSVILALYLAQVGLSLKSIGLLITLTLVGDMVISLWITTHADRIGRRKMLILGAMLMLCAGVVFVFTNNFILLVAAAMIGVISPSGNEIGPFLSVEQASLTQTSPGEKRTHIFAWYNMVGSFSTATGALIGGGLAHFLQRSGMSVLGSYRVDVIVYSGIGLLLALIFSMLSPEVEVKNTVKPEPSVDTPKTQFGLHRSKGIVVKLSALFALDAFGGGFVIQSFVAYWFFKRYGVNPAILGSIFFGANVLAGISALAAAHVAEKIGLINTMVFTHIPSNILLILVPIMPNLPLAITMLLLRFSISQMDVPTRQSYTMAVVEPDERSAASGVTAVARSVGAAISPVIAGPLLASVSLLSVPFFLSGGLKIIYDLLLYRSFKATQHLK
jgi:predicted MFS family arabinose efflux permease